MRAKFCNAIAGTIAVVAACAAASAQTVPASFIPLQITISPGTASCTAQSGDPLAPSDSRSTNDNSPLACQASGLGAASSTTEAMGVGGNVQGPLSPVVIPGSMTTITLLGIEGGASGYPWNETPAMPTSDFELSNRTVDLFNPNVFPVQVLVLSDFRKFAAAGNERAPLPYPGRAAVLGDSLDAGDGIAIFEQSSRTYVSGADCHRHSVLNTALFPSPPGPDPLLDNLVSGEHEDRDDTVSAAVCIRDVPANSTMRLINYGPGSTSARAGTTSITGDFDGDGQLDFLFHSGYAVYSAALTYRIMLADSHPSAEFAQLEIEAHSPVDLLVTSPGGRRVGFDLPAAHVVDELPGAAFTGHGTEPQGIAIPQPEAGHYQVTVQGIADGPYRIDIRSLDLDGNVLDSTVLTGTALAGQNELLALEVSPSGALTGSGMPDREAPSIVCGSADGAWHPADVAIACTATDSGSGLASIDDASFSLSTHIAPGTETADAATDSRTVCDGAGNCAAAGPISANRIDRRPPAIAVATPADNATYVLGQTVVASYGCADVGSGVAACAGTVVNGAAIDTASVGTKSLLIEARDAVGNSDRRSLTYAVGFGVCPLYDQTKAHKLGSAVPVKLRLCDADGRNVSAAAIRVHAAALTRSSDGLAAVVDASGNANVGGDFRYDTALDGYIFNLNTKPLATGTWILTFTATADLTPHSVSFAVR